MNKFPQKGDVIYANRGLYRHYGVYNNADSVIHFSPDEGKEINAESAYIRETTLEEFLREDLLNIDSAIRPSFSSEEIVQRARACMGEFKGKYNLVFFNCEHFARWCATGKPESGQVKKGAVIAGTVAATTAAVIIAKLIADKEKAHDGAK
jgi:hypothetical protein